MKKWKVLGKEKPKTRKRKNLTRKTDTGENEILAQFSGEFATSSTSLLRVYASVPSKKTPTS